MHSILEDRIRRLEALTAAGSPIDLSALDPTSFPEQDETRGRRFSGQLQLQTADLHLANHGDPDNPGFASGFDLWTYPRSPACYSDIGPDVDSLWATSLPQSYEPAFEPEFQTSLHKKSYTFPPIPFDQHMRGRSDSQTLLSPTFSDIPSIQITSHGGSRSPSPSSRPTDAVGFNMPIRTTLPDLSGLSVEQEWTKTPPLTPSDTNLPDASMDYYGDFLSPLDRPPTLPRRPSISSRRGSVSNMGNVADWSSAVSVSGSAERTKRRHTTCSIPRTTPSPLLSPEVSWMLDSPRTTNYLNKYFSDVHPKYPFLDQRKFFAPKTGSNKGVSPFTDPRSNFSTDHVGTFQRLLVGAIGGMLHQQSRDISARYIRHAVTLQDDTDSKFDMWSSISGLHCAMLLALYCYLETALAPFANEDASDDVSHPGVNPNLWLFNCRIASGCIDLGLHVSLDDGMGEDDDDEDREVKDLYRNTFRSAYVLDREISQLKRRPRAIHDDDVDAILVGDLR